jgi:membrane-bound lytic murein transglycosylase D
MQTLPTSVATAYVAKRLLIACCALLFGCSELLIRPQASTQSVKTQPATGTEAAPRAAPAKPVAQAAAGKPAPASAANAKRADMEEPDFWAELVANRRFTDCRYDPAIARWAIRLTANPANFNANMVRMQPYLDYVWRRIRALQMPSEVAFLPLVESDYRQVYGSYGSPGGWWQLMPDTGRTYRMDVSRNNDERVDPIKATNAALQLTQANAARFNNDWLLAIFAYNVGGLRIARVLEAKDLHPGQIEHVNQLGLPLETQDHIHRLIAWGCIFANPNHYRVSLPPALAPAQRLVEVRVAHTTPIAAMLATLNDVGPASFASEWKNQHPLISKRGEIRYGQHILAPAGTNAALAALGDLRRFKAAPVLARNTATTAKPTGAKPVTKPGTRNARSTAATPNRPNLRKNVVVPASVKVRNGDNLWTIARHFDMRVKEILALNPSLSRDSVLKLGQTLRLK